MRSYFDEGRNMQKFARILFIVAVFSSVLYAAVPVTHQEFQAVNADGSSAYDGTEQVIIEGIILNNPEDNLSPEPNSLQQPWFLGGQWQVFVQGEDGDNAGTACWMGQNYANGPGENSYTDQQWLDELDRVNYDQQTGYVFKAGDRVRITGWHLFYGGKRNINEQHKIDEASDFTIELLKPAVGLPKPEEITLADLKDSNDDFIFDPTRQTGGERYQARLVRIEGVTVTDPGNWAPGAKLEIQDTTGRSFEVELGLGKGISMYDCPTGEIDAVGILNQEGSNTGGYQLLVLNHYGNPLVLGDTGELRGNLGGDVTGDAAVDLADFAQLASDWLKSVAGL